MRDVRKAGQELAPTNGSSDVAGTSSGDDYDFGRAAAFMPL